MVWKKVAQNPGPSFCSQGAADSSVASGSKTVSTGEGSGVGGEEDSPGASSDPGLENRNC